MEARAKSSPADKWHLPYAMVRIVEHHLETPAENTQAPDLLRSVYCVLGMPIDAISMATVVRRIEAAAADRSTLLISTTNLNFLVSCLTDSEFRESVLDSDLC